MTDAEKRDKVIRGLTECVKGFGPKDCDECPYGVGDPRPCVFQLMRDALALLKEKEPKMVVQTTSAIRCPGCGKQITSKGALHKEIKYCWKCGQAVKWDD